MNKIYTAKEYEKAIEKRELIAEKLPEDESAVPEETKPLERKMEKIDSAIATFAISAGKPALSKGKPEYSWKRARRRHVTLDKP